MQRTDSQFAVQKPVKRHGDQATIRAHEVRTLSPLRVSDPDGAGPDARARPERDLGRPGDLDLTPGLGGQPRGNIGDDLITRKTEIKIGDPCAGQNGRDQDEDQQKPQEAHHGSTASSPGRVVRIVRARIATGRRPMQMVASAAGPASASCSSEAAL